MRAHLKPLRGSTTSHLGVRMETNSGSSGLKLLAAAFGARLVKSVLTRRWRLDPSSLSRVTSLHGLLDVAEARVPWIVGHIRTRPSKERQATARRLAGTLWVFNESPEKWDQYAKGVERTIRFMAILNWCCPDRAKGRGYVIPEPPAR